MTKADYDVAEESKVWYDAEGECWLLLRVPEGVDVGALGTTLWQSYVGYLRSLSAKPDDELQEQEAVV